ncbi:MAG TPA: hypothetical protein VFK56_21865 [Mycobacterium sp.]|jgi:hypothetical protein|nr:hypothetical protein [Mycobacterium sp.]
MARTIWIEEERGTYRGTIIHPHNGYDIGGFWSTHKPGSPTGPTKSQRTTVRRSGPQGWTNVT